MHTVDIRGGFTRGAFDAVAATIREFLSTYVSSIDSRFFAELGRFFVAGALTVTCGVMSRRESHENSITLGRPMYNILCFERQDAWHFLDIFLRNMPTTKSSPCARRISPESYRRSIFQIHTFGTNM